MGSGTCIKIPVRALEWIECLDDAQRGQLFTAILTYASTGEIIQLEGDARFLVPVFRQEIDDDAARARAISEKRREAGRKGGRGRWAEREAQAAQAETQGQGAPETPRPNPDAEKPKKQESVPPKPTESPTIITIPLADGSEYPVTEAERDEWGKLYPAVDVDQELRKIRGWNEANPTKRKTRRGIKTHINTWLAREQDKGGSGRQCGGGRRGQYGPPGFEEQSWMELARELEAREGGWNSS